MTAVLGTPFSAYAGMVSTFSGKVKAVFVVEKKVENNQVFATSQTMELFKPTIIDSTSTDGADMERVSNYQDSLQAVSGPLRFSTEDIDFPTTDTISVYEVKKGDKIEDVAKLFNVSVNTIIWANNLTSKTIVVGETLIILPITGIKHLVKKGDSVNSIAKKYKADTTDIASYNGISAEAALTVGDIILVPDGEIVVAPPKAKISKTKKSPILAIYSYNAPSDFLVRPIAGGRKSQGIHGHNGIDLTSSIGTPVLAAASGRVIAVKVGGYNGGYGNMIIISHEKGIQTVYAHLRSVSVTQGEQVTQGQQIGELGNTGRSTGPHLHFEVRGAKNPF